MNCPACREGNCIKCPDRIFLLVGKDRVCTCKRQDHEDAISGEARRNQVEDPFTGDVHAPGAVITKAGTLKRSPEDLPAD